MSEVYNRIEDLCAKKRISITAMCRETGISRSAMTELLSETASKIATYFGVSVDYVLGTGQKEKAPALAEEPTAEAFELKLYRALISGGIIPPGGDLTDKQVEILDAIATIIDATFGD